MKKEEMIDQLNTVGKLSENESVKEIVGRTIEFIEGK